MDKITQLFHQGGVPVMVAILATALISAVIILERVIKYWVQFDLPNSAGFMSNVQKMVMNNSIENAIRLCRKAKPKLLPGVIAQGLMRANDTPDKSFTFPWYYCQRGNTLRSSRNAVRPNAVLCRCRDCNRCSEATIARRRYCGSACCDVLRAGYRSSHLVVLRYFNA